MLACPKKMQTDPVGKQSSSIDVKKVIQALLPKRVIN